MQLGLILLVGMLINNTEQVELIEQTSQHTEAMNQYVINYCRQTGGSITVTPHPEHYICCYETKCLHLDLDKGRSEVIYRINKVDSD